MRAEQNVILACVGVKGAGKSTRMAALLRHAPRLIVFDTLGEHSRWLPNRLRSLDQLAAFLAWSRGRQTFAAAYIPGEDLEGEVDAVARAVYGRGSLCLGLEEVPLYCKPGFIPPGLGYLVRTGRHRGLDLAWTAQRAAEVPKTLTSLTDMWVLFRQHEPRDLAALAERCGAEVASKVASLGEHQHFVWNVAQRAVIPDSERFLKR